SPQVQVSASGIYVVTVTQNGCSGTDSALVDLRPPPLLGLPPLLTLCIDGGPSLFALPSTVDSIRWSSGATTTTFFVDTPGTYGAIGWLAGCESEPDSMVVERVDCSCQLYLPNAFTPNGDGVNDAWAPLLACDLEDITLMVFDRWGELLQTLTTRDLRWDGSYSGSPCPIGVYPYKLRYTVRLPDATLERPQERLGHVTIVR
ncbi:MAG TPA: T9SS type B sorting domain-containing protein, partial [Flavobacteriales bacterium]|nr:T9SS type B sorting domain-containing protein [Flavobacteriales bacterium]